jgi:diguanylate cyclase (GGDEF)-like protein
MLSFRALELDDAPGAWISFGLAMSFCVGMVSRAAVRPWIVLLTAAMLLSPIVVGGLLRPELPYKLGAVMLLLFWVTLREASRHLSRAFIDRLEAKLALAHQASHDALTGLPNRAAFLAALEGTRTAHAVISLDLDGFKPVNDRLGHHAGDALLREVAERLRRCIGTEGLAARMGGDEFMLLLPFAGQEPDADAALRLARHAVMVLGKPFDLDGPVTIGASAGIVLAMAGETESGSLLERVDAALYAAKRSGGGRWHWVEPAQAPGGGSMA